MYLLGWELLHPEMTLEHLGYLRYFLDAQDPRSAKEQFNERYQFGGFQPFQGFELLANNALAYPGDPPQEPRAQTKLRDETIVFYDHSWVAIIQPDRSFEVARLD